MWGNRSGSVDPNLALLQSQYINSIIILSREDFGVPNVRVSRSITINPQSPPLTINGTVLNESYDLVILGVTFDSKLTFEMHLR